MNLVFRRLFFAAFLLVSPSIFAEPPPGFQNEIVVVGLDQPTALEFLPDGRLLVAELQEEIFVVQPNAGIPDAQPFLSLDNTGIFGGQGLMDIELDPDFDANGYYYVYYTKGSLNRNRVSRFTASGNTTVAGSEVVLWQDIQPATDEHQGGAVVVGPDGKLYISIGEAFVPDDAPRLTSYRGKILRINKDGSIPVDNPFYDGTGPNLDAIWAYGLRNPFRLTVDALTGRIIIGEVGGNDPAIAQEEINVLIRGANYGWPECEGACATPGTTAPIYHYPHSGRDAGIIGGFVYRGNKFPNAYFGSYFFADYAQNWIRRLTFDTNGAVNAVFNFEPASGALDGDYGDPTGLKEGPDGALYYTDFTHDLNFYWAMVRRIRYVGSGNQPPTAIASASTTAGEPPLAVNFSSAGSADPEGQNVTFSWTFGDGATATNANPTHTYTQTGTFTVRLTVSDGVNTTMSLPVVIVVGNPPKVFIDSPTNGMTFRAGDAIQFTGHATDTEDGTLPPGALNWSLVFHHAEHIHPVFGDWALTNRGSLLIPTNGHPFAHDTSYELTLIATDSSGLQGAASIIVNPELVDVTVDSIPSGMTVKMDGISRTTPFTDGSVIGFQHSFEAPDQVFNGTNFIFQTWLDGGVQSRTVVVPNQDLHLGALFRPGQHGDLLIEYISHHTNGVNLRFTTATGNKYRIERSPTMLPGTWAKVFDQIIGTGSPITVTDPNPLTPTAFYRVIASPDSATTPPEFAASVSAYGLNQATLSTSLSSFGENRALLVGICWNDGSDDEVASVTVGGVACGHLFTTNWFYGTGKLAIYGLTAPPVGNQSLQVTMTGAASELAVLGILFTNANQSASWGTAVGNYGSLPSTATAIIVPSAASDLVVDFLGYYAFEAAPGLDQTLRGVASNPGYASLQASTRPGLTNSTPMAWSMSASTEISQVGIAIKRR
ncbi:MAG: PQQ-dependent sugar dehydrogenase [Verrucomicrobia bacterium]|nr:PQQ-dependent sugar dehydrogenase [Verrucomicrobiota bacterium]